MAATLTREARPNPIRTGFPPPFKRETTAYAIAFDMEIDKLRTHYGDPYNGAYQEVRKVLLRHGFTWQQGSVYFGGAEINAVTCVLAAQDLARSLPWFAVCVRDIRMLRIEEQNDLMAAVRQAAGPATGGT